MPTKLPPPPNFAAMDAAAAVSADRRTDVLALIGSLTFGWANNESMFIYMIMLLMRTDEASAAIAFATLNTTRARLDLVQRLAKIKIKDPSIARELTDIIDRFNRCNRIRNELNHSIYTMNERGEIVQTLSMRLEETRHRLRFGAPRNMDEARIGEMNEAIIELKSLNRDIWGFLPRLEAHLAGASSNSPESLV